MVIINTDVEDLFRASFPSLFGETSVEILSTSKETISKVKRQPSEWERIIATKQLTNN